MERYIAPEAVAKERLDGIPALVRLAWNIALLFPELGDEIMEDLRSDIAVIIAGEREQMAADARVKADAQAAAYWKERVMRAEERAVSATGDFAAATVSAGMDPHCWYVYLLWPEKDAEKPVYVGRSLNLFSRVGAHMSDPRLRYSTKWITAIDCGTEDAMVKTEWRLIRHYQPRFNTIGNTQ